MVLKLCRHVHARVAHTLLAIVTRSECSAVDIATVQLTLRGRLVAVLPKSVSMYCHTDSYVGIMLATYCCVSA